MKFKRIAVLPVAALAFGITFMQFSDASAVVETSWGPQDRATYTWASPADHVTFNSITDNPYLGDERNFVRIREAGAETDVDEIDVTPGKEYEVTVYYHNNASASLNASGAGISRNTYLRTEFPSYLNAGEIGMATAFISASNAEPTTVWDATYLKAASSVYLSFVPNSAVIHNNGTTDGTILSGDALTGSQGVTLGHYDNMWGMIPGCNEYGGYVTYKIRADAPNFTVDKQVALSELPDNYKDEIVVLPGDVLNFKINYKNTGTTEQTGVTAHDFLPTGLTYVAGSTYAGSTRHPEGSQSPENVLFGDGLGLGAMIVGEEAWVTYQAKVADDTGIFPCGDTVIYNGAYIATNDGQNSDKVKITVRRACATTPTKLPSTGPGEVVMAVAVTLIIIGGGFYFYKSQKMLRRVATPAGDAGAAPINPVNMAEPTPENTPADAQKDVPTEVKNETSVDTDVNEDIVRDGIETPKED